MICLAGVAGAPVQANVIFVSPGESIEAALSSSSSTDTIILEHGVYEESVTMLTRGATIGSRFLLDEDSSHISLTIVEPDAVHPDTQSCFAIIDCSDPVWISGLTLRSGLGTRWSEEDEFAGGCVYALRSRVYLSRCSILSGNAVFGGGIFAFRDEDESVNSLVLIECEVKQCWSTLWGGGVYTNRCSLEVRGTGFHNCFSLGESGGGMSVLSPNAVIEDCVFDSCAGIVGGLTLGDGHAEVRRTTFTNNSATVMLYAAHLVGGQGNYIIEGNYFGPTLSNTIGVRFCCESDDSTNFTGNVVEYNDASVRAGNIFFAGVAGSATFNIVRYNQSSAGAQLYCFQGTTIDIHHNVFEGNFSSDTSYASVLVTGPNARQRFHDNILTGNSGKTVDYYEDYPTTIDARNNWWGDASGPYHPTLNPTGLGDTLLSDSVLFEPWLLTPPDTSTSAVERPVPVFPVNWRVLNVYPSPFNGEFSVAVAGIMGSGFSLKLYDILGREVATLQEGRGHGGLLHYSAPAVLAAGIYFLRASEDKAIETRKVVFLK
ncbi:MAG: T9SS type A sorting domain-containing protein [bacterium]|nr:T9SS type A sorting domain-containing protein [bacterium]